MGDRERKSFSKCSSFYTSHISFLIILTMNAFIRKHIFCHRVSKVLGPVSQWGLTQYFDITPPKP